MRGRYETIGTLLCLLVLFCLPSCHLYSQPVASPPYRVGVCDWMILKRQKLGEFALTREIGADGVEMDMGGLGQRRMFDNKMREPHELEVFLSTAQEEGVKVPSIAMSGFFAQNFLQRDNYVELISDCLQTMTAFGARVAFLPLGGSGKDWIAAGKRHDEMVRRLRRVGEMALEKGVVIGIRTGQDARYDKHLLREIKSDGIKIYLNLQDAVDNGRDPCRELRILGRKRICQIHASLTDSVTLDRDPRIDMKSVRRTLDKLHWQGWLMVERSRDVSRVRDVKYNFSTNVAYLKEIFQNNNPK